MRIGVLETTQTLTEKPNRHISKTRAERFIYRAIARWVVYGKLLQMLKDDSEIRGDIQYFQQRITGIPLLKPPGGPTNLLLSYPHRDQRSAGVLQLRTQ